MDRQLQVEQFRLQGVLFCSSEVFFVLLFFPHTTITLSFQYPVAHTTTIFEDTKNL